MTLGRSRLAVRVACAVLGGVLLGLLRPVHAQGPVKIGGLAYLDYVYQLASPDDEAEGDNGFTYRRLYLTADAPISDAFSARARLEASESTVGPKGPETFVKDLYLKWNVGGGHALTFGVASPPAFAISEDVWGYRSLEKTIVDLNRVVSSRDFGVRANGPLAADGKLRYGLMVGNNEGVFPEDDKYKRVYGQIEYYPTEQVTLAIASNVAAFDGERERQVAVSALAGYVTDTWRIGAEGYVETNSFERADDATSLGLSVFGALWFTEQWGAVGRVDRVRDEAVSFPDDPISPASFSRDYATFGLVALVYQPHPQVQLMPNLLVVKNDNDDTADLQGRATVYFTF